MSKGEEIISRKAILGHYNIEDIVKSPPAKMLQLVNFFKITLPTENNCEVYWLEEEEEE